MVVWAQLVMRDLPRCRVDVRVRVLVRNMARRQLQRVSSLRIGAFALVLALAVSAIVRLHSVEVPITLAVPLAAINFAI